MALGFASITAGRRMMVLSTAFVAAVAVLMGSNRPALAIDIIPMGPLTAVTPAEKLFEAGLLALERNNLTAAESAFKESLKLDGGAAAPYMGLAQVALRRGEKEVAETHIKKALALAPNTASIQTTWGTYLYSQREIPAAEAALRKAISLDPKIMEAHLHLGDLYFVAFKKIDEAIKEYQTAVSLEPEHAGARYALGLAQLTKGEVARGEGELLKASKLAAGNPLPHQALGRLYQWQKQYDKALAAFDTALKLFPGFPAAHYERGQIFAAKGDDARAIQAYAEGQTHDPKRSIGHTSIGMVHQRNRRWAEARNAYLEAVKIEAQNAVALNNLAWMTTETKTDLSQGLAWAQKAVSIGPQVPEFQVTLAWVYRTQGNLAKAEETLRAAAGLKPQRASALYYLGRLYLERGKTSEGLTELKKALALDPNFDGSEDARKTLKQLGRG